MNKQSATWGCRQIWHVVPEATLEPRVAPSALFTCPVAGPGKSPPTFQSLSQQTWLPCIWGTVLRWKKPVWSSQKQGQKASESTSTKKKRPIMRAVRSVTGAEETLLTQGGSSAQPLGAWNPTWVSEEDRQCVYKGLEEGNFTWAGKGSTQRHWWQSDPEGQGCPWEFQREKKI